MFQNVMQHLPSQTPVYCLLSTPIHAHCGQTDLPHIYVYKQETIWQWWHSDMWSMNGCEWPFCLPLPFVWGDVDAICKVIALRHYFYILGTVVHNITPRLTKKRLHQSFEDLIRKVVIIGCKEAIHTHSNNIIYTEKKKQTKQTTWDNYYW